MDQHPIEGLMSTAMESIKDMVDVNTIVGDAVQAPDGTVIIPISKVSLDLQRGGEYNSCCGVKSGESSGEEDGNSGGSYSKYPFAGGSGAGVSINPVAFMVVGQGQIKLLPVTINSSLEKILDMVPDIVEKANQAIKKKIKVRKTIKEVDDEEA